MGNARGPGRLQECTTACPARLSAAVGRAHCPGPGKVVRTVMRAGACWPRARTLLPVRPHHEQAEDRNARARTRTNAGARMGLSVQVTWWSRLRLRARGAPLRPPLSLNLCFFLSFSLFFFFFFSSMNTHRVHLKATLPHFTGSFDSSLLRFLLQFKSEKKNNRT